MRDHRKLEAFELADGLVLSVYEATQSYPREELFGLVSQMRRAAVSVVANIVEGSARQGQNDYVRFLDISLGSLRELGYFVDLSRRLQFLSEESSSVLHERYEETARVLSGLIQSLRSAS